MGFLQKQFVLLTAEHLNPLNTVFGTYDLCVVGPRMRRMTATVALISSMIHMILKRGELKKHVF